MPLSWNEIRERSIKFSKEWADAKSEQGERQSFWNEFFEVFGMKRKMVATFEEPVKKLSGQWGFIDLFWKGVLLVEHKSRGKSLEKASSQAMDYIQGLITTDRRDECPRYVIMSDFERIALHDLEGGTSETFPLAEFHKHISAFGFIPGYKQHKLGAVEDPINIRAVELMGEFHDALEAGGYSGHDLERFLVRILFCLFSEDTGIFERNAFTALIENHTSDDGSNLGPLIARLFQVLNTPTERRQANLLEDLAAFPYVNGALFAENLGFADLNRSMRNQLLKCCNLDWSRISPAVFGSLFQSVMEPKERRQVGAHYTSERDILKLINSLFMDDLREEFQRIKNDKRKLQAFHEKLGRLKFFDPACGCGNFLVVTYRELRLLELEVLKLLMTDQKVTDIGLFCRVDVDSMHGIEINEFPALIAEVAMWLIDHQMNLLFSEEFGQYFIRLPLKKSAKIVNANALRIDWAEVIKPEECSYILGNPPFVGSSYQTNVQKEDLRNTLAEIEGFKVLDYVAAWYVKAVRFSEGQPIKTAFVSTNSITQGEQVGILWGWMIRNSQHIQFAHRTFEWSSEARGKAAVHCVIIGFSSIASTSKVIFDYETSQAEPQRIYPQYINPYLIDAPNVVLVARTKPIQSSAPIMTRGSQPTDGGNLLLSEDEASSLRQNEPHASKWLRRFLMGEDFINGTVRYCLWLKDASPTELQQCPVVLKRIDAVRKVRLESQKPATREWASKPSLFQEDRQPSEPYLAIPQVSSKRRVYIPIGYISPEEIAGNKLSIIKKVSKYDFGVIGSSMHMAWTKIVCGRLKSDYNYSSTIVYNNFPWPSSPSDKQKATVEARAQAVLDSRAKYPDATLADLYDPLTMPADLVKAHDQLDRAVELCYRQKPFASDRERVEFLFGLYEQLTAPLIGEEPKPKRTRKPKAE